MKIAQANDNGTKNGDNTADDLDYVPMPGNVKQQIEKLWASEIKDTSGKPVAFR